MVLVIMGPMCSGKTSLANKLVSSWMPSWQIKQILEHTSRPKRSDKESGYVFLTPTQFAANREDGKYIGVVRYQTVYGPWSYGIPLDDLKNMTTKSIRVIVTSPMAYIALQEWCRTWSVSCRGMLLDVPEEICIKRAFHRGDDAKEVHRRMAEMRPIFNAIKNSGTLAHITNGTENLDILVRIASDVIREKSRA